MALSWPMAVTLCPILGHIFPLIRLHSCRESCALLPDHAKLCSQEMPENAGATCVCQALHSMIRYLR